MSEGIRVEKLSKKYDKVEVVRNLSFEVLPGRICALVGPNGAGKTTTLRALGGLVGGFTGTVTLAGFDVITQAVQAKTMTGFVPETPQIYECLSAAEYLSFVASLRRLGKTTASSRSRELIDLFELSDQGAKPVGLFSKGMRGRLALCAALLHSPRILILDEPFDGIDVGGVILIKRLLREFAHGAGSVLLSSHVLDLVGDLCSNVVVIVDGEVVADGSPEAVRRSVAADTLDSAFVQLTNHKQ